MRQARKGSFKRGTGALAATGNVVRNLVWTIDWLDEEPHNHSWR